MFLALNSSNESSQIHYDEKDVMNAIHILRWVLANYVAHKSIRSWDKIEDSIDVSHSMWNELSEYILKYSWINTKTFYR
jgi:hypothetical protein